MDAFMQRGRAGAGDGQGVDLSELGSPLLGGLLGGGEDRGSEDGVDELEPGLGGSGSSTDSGTMRAAYEGRGGAMAESVERVLPFESRPGRQARRTYAGKGYQVRDLDIFLTRVYSYYLGKGFMCSVTAGMLNILTLGFTIVASAIFLLVIDWAALFEGCPETASYHKCDLAKIIFRKHGFQSVSYLSCVILYLVLLSCYWCWTVFRLFVEIPALKEMRCFTQEELGIQERELQTMDWSDVVDRIVQTQDKTDLTSGKIVLDHLDIMSRIMRKDNYFIGMINAGVVDLRILLPGLTGHLLLTRTLEWNLRWCIMDCIFNEQHFVRKEFVHNVEGLKRRLHTLGIINLCLAPFVLVFMLIFLFLRNAENCYHSPGSIGQRQWSELARWRMREFNEAPHLAERRLRCALKPASAFVDQFPSPLLNLIAKFVSFIVGSFAAVLIIIAFIDESLLEAVLGGRTILWYAAVLGTFLAISRAFIRDETFTKYDPEGTMEDVAMYTHYFPLRWHGRCESLQVYGEVEELFQTKVVLFFKEVASIILTPLMLMTSLPHSAREILKFIEGNTIHVEGVGHVCRLAEFNECGKFDSAEAKVESSFVTFSEHYPRWVPSHEGQTFLEDMATFSSEEQRKMEGQSASDMSISQSRHSPEGYSGGGPSILNHRR